MLIRGWWGCRGHSPLWRTVWGLLAEVNTLFPRDPATALAGDRVPSHVHDLDSAEGFPAQE